MIPVERIIAYKPSQSLTDTLVKVALIGTGVYLLTKVYRDYQKNKTEKETGTNPAVQQAQALRVAMNPAGLEWLRRVDGTSLQAIFDTASKITKIEDVADAYKKLYQSSLYEDLQTELSAGEYQKFLNLFKYNPESKTVNVPTGNWVVTRLETNARKTPKLISKLSFNNNIIKLVPAGKYIGFTTGKKSFDAENNAAFMELKTYDGKQLFWVAVSQVDMYTKADFEKRFGKNYGGMIETFRNVSFSGFISRKNVIVLKAKAPVYNQYGEVMARPEAKTILGNYIMEITKKDKTSLIQFKNIEGNIRLVDKKYVQIINV